MDRANEALGMLWVFATIIGMGIAFTLFIRLSGWKSYIIPGICVGFFMGPCILEIPFVSTPVIMPSGYVWPVIVFSVIFEDSSLRTVPLNVLLYPIIMGTFFTLIFLAGTKLKKKPTNSETATSKD